MKPFHGITFCPTAMPDIDTSRLISKQIIKLGGIFSKDLTKQVNVLIIGNSINTAKYKFAVRYRYDIIFINISAITKLYELWLSGEDITLKTHSNYLQLSNDNRKRMLHVLQSRYSMNPLFDAYLFVGRINSEIENVKNLQQLANLQGCYKCNITHFVKDCKENNKNRLILFITDCKTGARVLAAREQNIPIVHFKWIQDCLKRNAMLEYDPYYLLDNVDELEYDQIGIESCECWDKLNTPALSLPSNETHQQQEHDSNNNNNNSTILLNKFKSKGDKIWQKAMSNDQTLQKPLISSRIPDLQPPNSVTSTAVSFFNNCNFYIHPLFPKKHYDILESVIKQNNGNKTVSATDDSYTIVPSNIPFDEIDLSPSKSTIVTEFFIERCLHYKSLLLPIDSWSKPFFKTSKFQIKPQLNLLHNDGHKLHVSITGFHGVELLHLNKILKFLEPMGIQFSDYLNKSTDVLLINLSSLPSITKDHQLWKNEYSDLFTNETKNSNNKVFRNSMKKKIEFIKQQHSIPVVTPAFLLNLFFQNDNTDDSFTVYLNNIKWCIICPRGKKNDFSCQLIPTDNTNLVEEPKKQNIKDKILEFENKNELFNNPVKQNTKENRLDFLQKINETRHSLPANKKSHFISPRKAQSVELKPDVEEPDLVPVIKRKRLNSENPPQTVTRQSSWGKIMSEKVTNTDDESFSVIPNSLAGDTPSNDACGQFEASINLTQVTYGTSHDSKKNNKPAKKLTRQRLKDIGI